MPRRERDTTVTTTESTPVATDDTTAGGSDASPDGAEAAATPKAPKPDKPLGPMTTRTGAEALVIKAPKGQRVFTAGGDKGSKIAELLRTRPDMPRKDIAATVGCSQSRVAEVARVLGISKSREETAAAAASAQPPAEESQPQTEAANA